MGRLCCKPQGTAKQLGLCGCTWSKAGECVEAKVPISPQSTQLPIFIVANDRLKLATASYLMNLEQCFQSGRIS